MSALLRAMGGMPLIDRLDMAYVCVYACVCACMHCALINVFPVACPYRHQVSAVIVCRHGSAFLDLRERRPREGGREEGKQGRR